VGTIAAGVSLAVNVPLNILLIPRMGISGAALASTICYTVGAIVVLAMFLRISKNSWVDTLLLKREDLRIYRSALSTARRLDVKYAATALTDQAFSLFSPSFWRGKSVSDNSSPTNEEQPIVRQEEDKES
jgi:Na+-driven multidrug efflux pump